MFAGCISDLSRDARRTLRGLHDFARRRSLLRHGLTHLRCPFTYLNSSFQYAPDALALLDGRNRNLFGLRRSRCDCVGRVLSRAELLR